MKWYEMTSWLQKSAGSAASGAASAIREGQQAVERAELQAQLKREAEALRLRQEKAAQKAARQEMLKDNLYHAARRKAAEQLKTYGIPVTPTNLKRQVDSKFSWANQQYVYQQQEMRSDAIGYLMESGVISPDKPASENEIYIQKELKKRQMEEAMRTGNYQAAKALLAETDWITEHGMLPPLPTEEVPLPEAAKDLPWLYATQIKALDTRWEAPPDVLASMERQRELGILPESTLGGDRHWFWKWSGDIPWSMWMNSLYISTKKEKTPEEEKFLDAYINMNNFAYSTRTTATQQELRASSELETAYANLSTAQKLVAEITNPIWFLVPGPPIVKGVKALRALRAARVAGKVVEAVPPAKVAEVVKPVKPIVAKAVTPEVTEKAVTELREGFYNKIFDIEPAEATVARLFPKNWEQTMATAAGKVPGGKPVVRLINPTITPRETLEARKAQELYAIWLDRTARRSPGVEGVIESHIRAGIPDGDAIKLFDIDDLGLQHAFAPKKGYENASRGIIDVLEHPYKWELNEPARRLTEVWGRVRESAIKNLGKWDIKVNKAFYEEGAGYFPRMVKEASGEVVKYPRVRFEKPRHYATQLEAIDNNVVYTRDPIENIKAFIKHANELIATKDFQESVRALGRLPTDVIPTELVVGRKMARANVRGLEYAQKMINRIGRGEQIPTQSLKALKVKIPQYGDDVTHLLELSGSERRIEAARLAKVLKAEVAPAKSMARGFDKQYTAALKGAQSNILGEFERGTKHPLFRGRLFPQEVAEVLDDFSFRQPNVVWRSTQDVASTLRTLVAAMDFSPMFIQGLPMLGRFPAKWAKTTGLAFDVLFHPNNAHTYLAKAENAAIRMRHPPILKGTFEFYEALPKIAKIPIVGKPIAKVYKPFERFFTFWGDAARTELAKALEPAFIRAGEAEKLATYVNRMTGVMETRALGIGSTQRAIETSWVFFAPRYTRSCMAYVGNLFSKGIVGYEARRSLGQLAAGGAIMYAATAKALGQEPQFDPRYPDFMTLQVGNRNVGIGGFYYSFLRFTADLTSSVLEDGPAKRQDFLSLSRKDNPFIKFMYNRASPLTGLTVELFQRRDYLGQPFETPADWAHWLFVEHMMPIALQEMVPAPGEEFPSRIPEILIAEEFGMRTFPREPFYELRDTYSQQVFGQTWSDLYDVSEEGKYSMSKKHDYLLENFPDLKEAYDKWHVKAAERWKAEHKLE